MTAPATTPHTTLGGRQFQPVTESTSEHDIFVRAHLNRAGLAELHMQATDTPDAFAQRIMGELLTRGEVFLILGALMMPAELPVSEWSPAMAETTGEFLKKLTAPEDKALVHRQIASVVAGFLSRELVYLSIFPNSSQIQ